MTDDPLERALTDLRPAFPGTNLPALMYRAGQASRDRAVAGWRAAFAAAVVGLGGTWAAVFAFPERLPIPAGGPPAGPPPLPAIPPADSPDSLDESNLALLGRAMFGQPRSPSARPIPPVADAGPPTAFAQYLRVRNEVLSNGLAGLPPTPPPPEPMSAADLERWLGLVH